MSLCEDGKRQSDDLQVQLLQAVTSRESVSAQLSEIQRICSNNTLVLENLKSSEVELKSSLRNLEEENSLLRGKLDLAEGSKNSNEAYLSELIDTNQSLSGKFYQVETRLWESENKVKFCEENLSHLNSEKRELIHQVKRFESENKDLHDKLTKAVDDLEHLRDDYDKKQTHFEAHLSEISSSKEKSDEKLKEIKVELAKLEKEKSELTVLCSEMSSKNNQSNLEYQDKIKQLINDVETYKKTDSSQQGKLHSLEKLLKEMKESEVRVSERVSQLEGREKELLEQIADIEVTVIVPLENENQELKDEINAVKQERDDTKRKMTKLEEEQEEQLEMIHKSLEDSLLVRDELEKKVEILSKDVNKLEQEKENLMKKIVDLEASKSEYIDKVEILEDEVERLHVLEKTTSLVEETETCLMDRVLDLEEKEQQLLSELAKIKNKSFKSSSNQTDGDLSQNDSVLEKLKYLEKKNSMLEDAEGRYMDKILDLEEVVQSLQSGMNPSSIESNFSGSSEKPIRASTEEPTIVSVSSIKLAMQNNAPNIDSTACDGKPQTLSQSSTSSNRADTRNPSEQSLDPTDVSFHIIHLQNEIQNLTDDCKEKALKLEYLQEKCELLHDSEAKLMEKLSEKESVAENGISDSCVSELKRRLEILTEENEFLAENVENFKQLYKEQKEKTNDLHDRFLENNSNGQELLDTQAELKAAQLMVEEIQSEYEEQLAEKELNEVQLKELLNQSQQAERDLLSQVIAIQKREEDLNKKITSLYQASDNPQELVTLLKNEKHEALQKLESELKSQFSIVEEELQKEIQMLQSENLKQQSEQREIAIKYHNQLKDSHKERQELQTQVDNLIAKEVDLQKQIRTLRQNEEDLLRQVDKLERQMKMKTKVDLSCESPEDESIQSDSGMSADDQQTRYSISEKGSSDPSQPLESPTLHKVFSSSLTLNLSQPSSPPPSKNTTSSNPESISPEPVPPPRRGRTRRQSSFDSVSQEELSFLVEELQHKELTLKKRIRELEAEADSDLSQRVEELELENQHLQRKLKYAESKVDNSGSLTHGEESRKSVFLFGDSNNNDQGLDSIKDLDRSFSSILSSSSSYPTMLDKSEDVLNKKVKELENLDRHNKTQLAELEKDREVLHEIARKDKTMIHDLNVKVRELQLSERSLREQVNSLEASESSLFTKCEDLEATKTKLEDCVHELSIHERRLRELVRKLKLDEEHWLSRSGGMESAVAELAANEQQLKRLIQDVEMQKGGLSERAGYLESRVQELESVEAALLQRLKGYENIEVNFQNRLIQMENSERAAHSKVTELDVLNLDLSQRLHKALEESVVLTQHNSQLQGQINELDRRLLSSQDSELAHKQHVESLQKNESSLQRKVREFELREIDTQSRVRELEQMNEILSDKLAALLRSENRLKVRVQELEETVGKGETGGLTATQKQRVPQKLEDAQKHVLLLQNQVENLQLQLREVLKVTQTKFASKTDDGKKVLVPVDEYRQLHTSFALLEETMYQMEEAENINKELNETILQLRQGKGASSHEAEIEVLKRRLASYKTFINKLKSSLSVGQATSLWDPELDSGLQGDTLPARQLHGLESERVLQSVRGLQEGKAETFYEIGAQQQGLVADGDTIVQSKATLILSRPGSVDFDDDDGSKPEQASSQEESHWRAIEARKPRLVASSRGGATATVGSEAKLAPSTNQNGGNQSSALEVEEVMISLNLQSESELSSHYRTNQNDTDSSDVPVAPPRRVRAHRAGTSTNNNNSGNESSDGLLTESDTTASTASATNKKHSFANQKSLPSAANNSTSKTHPKKLAPLTPFGEDSYLPSSTQEGVDSLDDGKAPPLPHSGPPGGAERLQSSIWSKDVSTDEKGDSLDNSSSGMSIRDRIKMIEKHLQSDKGKDKADDEVFHWKKKAQEGLKQADVLEKDNKHLKDEINRLEKELEEKCRHINILELWLMNFEDLLKNKSKQTDRHLIEQLNLELTRLHTDLNHVRYHRDEAVLDPAAMKTELERKNREIVSKRHEIEALAGQLKHCQKECRNIEGMRRTTLDCLRAMEQELVALQEKEKSLHEMQGEIQYLRQQKDKTKEVYTENLQLRDHVHEIEAELLRLRNLCDDFNNLSARYEEMESTNQQTVNMIRPLQVKLESLVRKCQEKDALLHRLGDELRRSTYRPSSALDDLEHMENTQSLEEYSADLPQSLNRPIPHLPKRHRGHSLSSSAEELEQTHSYSDTDTSAASKRKRPTPYVNTRPKSVDALGSGSRAQRGTHAHPRSAPGVRRSRVELTDAEGPQDEFVAIADYDPMMFSQSGRPGLELGLREGEILRVLGPIDRTGYCEADVGGRIGLVPANYLQALHDSSDRQHYHSDPRLSQGHRHETGDPWLSQGHRHETGDNWLSQTQDNHRAGQMMDIYQRLHQDPSTNVKDTESTQRMRSNELSLEPRRPSDSQELLPDPPTDLKVKSIMNETSIVLSWLPPRLDNKGKNNGIKLLGFKVFLDNHEYIQILSPKICEIAMENLNLDKPHHLSVQSVCVGGHLSPRSELIFEGIFRMAQGHGGGQDDLDTDLSSVLNSANYKQGHRRTVMALYDYNPELQSPLNYTSFELGFRAGQVIYVFGDQRPDGFFHGEVDGKQGFVPACFVEDISERTQASPKQIFNRKRQARQTLH